LIEYGHAQMVLNVLNGSCRKAARLGTTAGIDTAGVLDQLQTSVGSAIDPEDATYLIKDAGVYDSNADLPGQSSDYPNLPDIELADAQPRQLFLIRVTVDYNDVALVPMPFMEGIELSGQAFMRHE
jgi:hypothetical protein